ncbi:hypothetical protein EON63_16940 [archaeon]|nr:MAG: hypothetical protein EON63_16940 [archaeon]
MIFTIAALFIILRVLHRLYYLLFVPQQCHYAPSFSPKQELEAWITKHGIASKQYCITSSTDNVKLSFRLLGTGRKKILLANGVGTGLFMWLPSLQAMLATDPDIFSKCTLIVSTYRGLFADSDEEFSTKRVEITMKKCIGTRGAT